MTTLLRIVDMRLIVLTVVVNRVPRLTGKPAFDRVVDIFMCYVQNITTRYYFADIQKTLCDDLLV